MAISSSLPAASLPVQLTAFIGREHELGTVRQLIAEHRLITLTGAGGSGKTRLALETLRRLQADDSIPVAWVELTPLTDPATVAAQLALSLGIRTETGPPLTSLAAFLRERRMLLVLDNCEHLVDECARIVERLLRECPRLRVLATSREPLGIGGERAWLVPGMSLPESPSGLDADAVARAESVRLFVDRARETLPAFTLTPANADAVARICRRLDGLPLAIELAAARSNLLTPDEIAERLDDRFGLLTSPARSALPRHRTLRAAVDWSYELLSDPERLLLQRLSVFAGGFTLDAAEQVCAGGIVGAADVLDRLGSLVARSLVTMQEEHGRARYRLLETIREYAAARRHEHEHAIDVAERHAAFYLALARQLEPEVILGRSHRLRQLDLEHDNIRAALAWSARHGKGAEYGLPLAWAMMWYWFHRQLWPEGFGHYETALASASEPSPECRAAALHALGIFGLYIGDARCEVRLAEAEQTWRSTGNLRWLAFTLICRTIEASMRGDIPAARRYAENAVAVAGHLGDAWVEALATVHALVAVLIWEQRWDEARQRLAYGEQIYREHDYIIGIAYVLDTRGYVELQLGNLDEAISLACASLRANTDSESRWLAGRSLRTLGAVAYAREDLARAARLFGAALGMYEAIGANPLMPERSTFEQVSAELARRMPPADYDAAREAGRAMSFGAALAYALEAQARPAAPASVAAGAARSSPADVLAIRTLGGFDVLSDGESAIPNALRQARPRELLVYLLAHPEGRTRDQAGVDFWPDHSPVQVKNNFHVTLHHLRKAIGSRRIRFEGGRYSLSADGGIDYDAGRFESDVHAALSQLARSPDSEAAGRLASAVETYRGPYLAGEQVGEWHVETRERLERLHADALTVLADAYDAAADYDRAAGALRKLLASDPLREDAARRLMSVLERAGRRVDALRVYDRLAAVLRDELGVEPDPETQALAGRLRGEGS